MPNYSIIPPRVEFLDERTGKISREWYMFFYNLANLTFDISISYDPSEGATTSAEFSSAENAKRIGALEMLAGFPDASPAEFGKVNQRLSNLELEHDWPYATKADIRQANQRVSDLEVNVAMLPVTGGGGSGLDEEEVIELIEDTVDADYIAAAGYWTPVTDGASNIIYSDGLVVVTWAEF